MNKTWQLILLDMALTFLSVVIGLILRLEIIYVDNFIRAIWPFILLAVLVRPLVFYLFGIYDRIWRHASSREFMRLAVAILVGTVILAIVTLLWLYPRWMSTFPRSLLGIEAMTSLFLLGGVRVGLRLVANYLVNGEGKKGQEPGFRFDRTLIIGAGTAGSMIVEELRANLQLGLKPVAFLDDNPNKIGRKLQGLNVYGPKDRLAEVVENQQIDLVVIAMPSAPGEVIRTFVELGEDVGVPTRIVPGLYEILSGRVNISRLQPVKVNDLLRRESVVIDSKQVKQLLVGKRVLVTGGGGSIGSELCGQILACEPARLVALGHGENSLYSLVSYLTETGCDCRNLVIQLADIRDLSRLETIFTRYQPEIVFHTAAHKHVPLLEDNIDDAVTNNVIGTWQLVQLSRAHSVERFVLISTDKAVKPVNIMGMTKRVAEMIVHLAAMETGKPYVSVRFGNVLGSRGSVVPLFRHQIASGGPVTVTDPEMERYFMTIPEAVQLVLQASALGKDGEVFVLDMGEPVKIDGLARDMIELSGYRVGQDIEIVYTGLRPGERLSEPLFNEDEDYTQTEHEKIFSAEIKSYKSSETFHAEIKALQELAKAGQIDKLRRKLEQITGQHI